MVKLRTFLSDNRTNLSGWILANGFDFHFIVRLSVLMLVSSKLRVGVKSMGLSLKGQI